MEPAINHIASNPLHLDIIKFLHLAAMSGSILFFVITAGNLLFKKEKIKQVLTDIYY